MKFEIFFLISENFRIKFKNKSMKFTFSLRQLVHKSVQGLTLSPVYVKVYVISVMTLIHHNFA